MRSVGLTTICIIIGVLGANVLHFKQASEPFGKINSITNYSVHIGKSWLNGALSTSLEVASPFSKYSKLENTVSNTMFSTKRINYMNARRIGLNLILFNMDKSLS